MPGKLSDEDIRQRLEAHNYNVPAITDTTRSVLVKKLRQLDQQHKSSNKPSIDYSSAEEDFTPPVSSTRKNIGAMYSARSRAGGGNVGYYRNGSGNSNTPGSRTSYKGNTTPVYKSRVVVGSYSNRMNARNGGSLVNVSDDDDEVEDEEEEEEDEDEDESDEADDDSVDDKLDQYEEEITSISRTDLATQTSFNNSSPPPQHDHQTETRFRGKPLPSPAQGGVGTSPTQYTLRSPHLRQNLNKFGSLNEALATMPTSSSSASPSSGYQSTAASSSNRNLSIVHQASPVQVQTSTSQQRISNNNNNYSKQQQQQMYNNRVINNNNKNSSNSILISSLIVGCAALFFMYLGYKYINLSPPASTNLLPAAASEKFPLCTGAEPKEDINVKCIPGPQYNPTADLLQQMLVVLRPGDQLDCPEADQQSLFSVDELRATANIESDQEFSQLFQNLLILFRRNIAWGIHPVYGEDAKSDTVTYLSVDIQRSIYCRLKGVVYIVIQLLYQAANYLFAIGLALMVVAGGWYGWKLLRQRKQREEHEMYALLEQVLIILQDNHAEKEAGAGGSGGNSPSFLAIVHIRDQLIPPQERSKKSRVWNKVANYIRNHESRVREEVQHIHGEEFRVWQWLSDMPPKSPISGGLNSPAIIKAYPGRVHTPVYSRAMPQHSSPVSMTHSTPASVSPGSSGSSPSARMYNNMGEGNKSKDLWPFAPTTTAGTPGWQGSAFQLNRNVSAPVHPPTNCIKARHMFEYCPATLSNPDWANIIKRDILNRCKDAKILHIAVDQESKEGIVYIKAMTMEDAGKVFSNLHGQWYKSQLVTAKYLREDRYHQRFPGSMKAVHKMTMP